MQPTVSPPSRPSLWHEIVETTREACLLRQEGREAEAVQLLQGKLPPIIRTWSSTCGETPERCRQRLKELFTSEQEQMRTAMLQRRLIVDEVCSRMGLRGNARSSSSENDVGTRATRDAMPIQLRRRVAFGDVVGMLDALQEAERGALEEAMIPARVARQNLSSVGNRPLTAVAVG